MNTVTPQRAGQVVFTNKARCRDCYRCVRVCPVKAIRMHEGQAFVDEERCISCGTCIRECPQGAKTFRNDVDRAARLIASGKPVAASIAPSFASVFRDWERHRLASALRKLGFSHVAETAIGAFHVASAMAGIVAEQAGHPHIATACPAVVNYVERYQGDLIKYLLPVVSPMLAHARHIKKKLGPDTKVVFIGPCVAKKAEAERPEHAGLVDCVLTFVELLEWLGRENITLASLEESRFDEEPEGDARFFPLLGGAVRTAHMNTDLLTKDVLDVHGFQDTREALESVNGGDRALLVEALLCPMGCINGPAIPGERNLYDRRLDVLDFAGRHKGKTPSVQPSREDLATTFQATRVETSDDISEDQIRQVLEKTGKSRPEDQLNCGACGYSSCREKAIAVVRGLAEPEMCIPYLRHLAERRTDKIIETSPNGIVILDEKLTIVSMNPTFRRMFMCSEAVCGKRISYLMDPEPFERLASGDEDFIESIVKHDKYGLVCHEKLYPLREDRQYVGIFANITKSQADREKLDQLRSETVRQARDLLEHQIGLAQKIAVFLGESTSRGEELVEKLVQLANEGRNEPGPIEDET